MLTITVVIPVYNEAALLPNRLLAIQARVKHSLFCKLLIVDGNSTDNSFKAVQDAGFTVIKTSKGRAIQMNFGAENTDSEIIYFLHLDSMPPLNFDEHIRSAVLQGASCGCFRLKFDSEHWWFACIAWPTRFNWNPFRGGDQSLFVTQKHWKQFGGFKAELICFEDHEILPKLQRNGHFVVLKQTITTSARRYHQNGLLKLQLIFIFLKILYYSKTVHANKIPIIYKRLVK